MIIANPLYDTAFKSLISDEVVAKAVIGALLETEVLEIDVHPTEYVRPQNVDDKLPKSVRLDYCVKIKNEEGEVHKVLIEIQKASGARVIYRFREYLALAGYRPKTTEETQLPIITIYFLGFELKNIPTSCLHVSRQYVDMHDKKVIKAKEQFVELLTHDSYIIQVPRIKTGEKPTTKLETVLSVFEQIDIDKVSSEITMSYNFPIKDDYQKKMVDILQYIGADPITREKMEGERYWLIEDEFNEGERLKKEKLIAEKDKAIVEKDKTIAEKDKTIINVVKVLKKKGMPVEEIAEMTELSIEDVTKII